MAMSLNWRRGAVWLAIAAMAFNALWPLAANAKPSGAFDPSAEICTVNGAGELAGGKVQPHPAQLVHLPDCSFCTLGADKPALPAAVHTSVLFAPQAAGFQAVVVRFLLPGSPGYSPAHPRAPPVFS